MTTPSFPMSKRGARGYRVAEVDRFLTAARAAFDGDDADADDPLTSADIRTTSFRLRRKGYSVPHVDAALERLEDAFALREREGAQALEGPDAWLGEARDSAQVILDRLSAPDGERFDRAARLKLGYSVEDVDAFAAAVADYFQGRRGLTVAEVRQVAFRPQRGGYRDTDVDALLGDVVAVMLAVR
ncbi:DivIVA domain-containing protein [Mycetocola reblochoni]|uniref:DivIVA domain-containing protein n=2 Tax=Mycetocola reblochoni TaxID=331618 RepID=A0A1R4JD11_9MICO|nr:DivIVA domain-containing protein [Mycetocola reblochoni]RLP69978.1 DivIVA domain-containing protein [Mycetocola reblochoni]SJN29613.1 hypothetical protein FM119_06695 [Mycetocola reblochoni REB411]